MHKSLRILTTLDRPLTLAQAKLHLRVNHTLDDASIDEMISAGIEEFQDTTGRAFARITAELCLSEFPDGPIAVPRPPLVSVESITYLDAAGESQTLAESDYQVHTNQTPGLITPVDAWPTAYDQPGSIVVTFTAGTPAESPPRIVNALKLWLDLNYHEHDAVQSRRIQDRISGVLSQKRLRDSRFAGLET